VTPLRVIHIVRKYGPVGGMERTVWELTSALTRKGHSIKVLCEELCEEQAPPGVKLHCLGTVIPKPRWLAYLRFSRRVFKWLQAHPHPGWIIHSHERISVHCITTFHSQPFALVRSAPWWKRSSLRAYANLWLEKRELCGTQVRKVVPCSSYIARLLTDHYPCVQNRLTSPVIPGIKAITKRKHRAVSSSGGIIGFVGKEWKRKGLVTAVAIVHELRKSRPDLELWVAGPKPAEVEHLFSSWNGGYRLLGHVNAQGLYSQLDLLLHPASMEAYGLVIIEAMAACVPVVVSSACGAADDIGKAHGAVLTLNEPVSVWAETVGRLLDSQIRSPGYQHTWEQFTEEYEGIYATLNQY
jgi:UDP-glucose:(heptosyl)LPS alpha-1,3-glucosyltransferase